jgi:uncharacterized membrane protein YqjE
MSRSNERPLGDVLQDIVSNIQGIIRSEFHLAKAEIEAETAKAAKPVLNIAIGTFMALYAGGFALLAAVYALSMVMADWTAALIVAVAVAVTATLLIHSGMKGLKRVKVPERTIESVKETMEWTRDQTK